MKKYGLGLLVGMLCMAFFGAVYAGDSLQILKAEVQTLKASRLEAQADLLREYHDKAYISAAQAEEMVKKLNEQLLFIKFFREHEEADRDIFNVFTSDIRLQFLVDLFNAAQQNKSHAWDESIIAELSSKISDERATLTKEVGDVKITGASIQQFTTEIHKNQNSLPREIIRRNSNLMDFLAGERNKSSFESKFVNKLSGISTYNKMQEDLKRQEQEHQAKLQPMREKVKLAGESLEKFKEIQALKPLAEGVIKALNIIAESDHLNESGVAFGYALAEGVEKIQEIFNAAKAASSDYIVGAELFEPMLEIAAILKKSDELAKYFEESDIAALNSVGIELERGISRLYEESVRKIDGFVTKTWSESLWSGQKAYLDRQLNFIKAQSEGLLAIIDNKQENNIPRALADSAKRAQEYLGVEAGELEKEELMSPGVPVVSQTEKTKEIEEFIKTAHKDQGSVRAVIGEQFKTVVNKKFEESIKLSEQAQIGQEPEEAIEPTEPTAEQKEMLKQIAQAAATKSTELKRERQEALEAKARQEKLRKAEEAQRLALEMAEREKAEQIRRDAELARQIQEQERVERERHEAEERRLALEETRRQEELRKQQETQAQLQRIADERKAAEAQAKQDELRRQEEQRKAEEQRKLKDEQLRMQQEEAKRQADKQKQLALDDEREQLEAQRAEERKRQKEETLRRQEELRKREEAELQLALEQSRKEAEEAYRVQQLAEERRLAREQAERDRLAALAAQQPQVPPVGPKIPVIEVPGAGVEPVSMLKNISNSAAAATFVGLVALSYIGWKIYDYYMQNPLNELEKLTKGSAAQFNAQKAQVSALALQVAEILERVAQTESNAQLKARAVALASELRELSLKPTQPLAKNIVNEVRTFNNDLARAKALGVKGVPIAQSPLKSAIKQVIAA